MQMLRAQMAKWKEGEMRLQIERNGLDTPTQLPGVLLSYLSVSWRMTRIEISKEKTICQLEETLNTSSLRASTFLPQRNSDEGLMNLASKAVEWECTTNWMESSSESCAPVLVRLSSPNDRVSGTNRGCKQLPVQREITGRQVVISLTGLPLMSSASWHKPKGPGHEYTLRVNWAPNFWISSLLNFDN